MITLGFLAVPQIAARRGGKWLPRSERGPAGRHPTAALASRGENFVGEEPVVLDANGDQVHAPVFARGPGFTQMFNLF